MKALGDSRLSSKFQVTVPRDIRSLLGLKAGDLLVFVVKGDEVLLKRGEVQIQDLTAIDVALQRANSIVEDLYAYSKDIGLNLADVDLAKLIEETLHQVQIPSSIHLNVKVPSVTFQADSNRLQRAFVNLAKNAVEAMPNGGTLTIGGHGDGEFVVLTFEDSGPGMDAEMLANIWQPFNTTKAKGLGLGLAICKRFVEAHGGTVTTHSTPSVGTTIMVRLPLRQSGRSAENGGESIDG
jgi:AbrB family looped-hinge helix DNA binding protein